MKEAFNAMKDMHKERVSKTPARLAYAVRQLEENDIEFYVKDASTGHIQAYKKSDDELVNFWVGTGTINSKKSPMRGIHNLVKMCKGADK